MINTFRKNVFFVIFLVLCIAQVFCQNAHSLQVSGETEVQAAHILSEKILHWLNNLPDRGGKVGIFQIRTSSPLNVEYGALLETEVLRESRKQSAFQMMNCFECRAPHVQVDGENLVVSKGVPDLEALKQLGQKNGVDSFLIIDLFRTNFSIYAEAVLYKSSNGEVIGADQFKVAAFELNSKPFLLMFSGGIGKVLGPRSNQDNIPFSLNLKALEELGFGKGGLSLGGIVGGPNGNMLYIAPTIGFRTRFGATPVYSITSVGAGFGYTGAKAGLATPLTFDVFIGSFTVIGIDMAYLFPVNGLGSNDRDTLKGYIGFHLGVSLGH